MFLKSDLHIHSTVSDGSDTIPELIEKAKKRGLSAIAIVEHDSLSHMRQIPAEKEIQVAAGVEISAYDKKTKTTAHLLGYGIKKPDIVTALTQPVLEARSRLSEKQAEIISGMGYDINIEKLPRADGKYLYKQHIMAWLRETGQVEEMFGDFFRKTFRNGGVCDFFIEYTDVFDAVRAVKEAGGLAVLAHPGQQANFNLIPKLAGLGLDGLEISHYANSEKDKEILRGYAAEYGLFLTGGSDYHGKYSFHQYTIGDFLSEESGVTAIFQPSEITSN